MKKVRKAILALCVVGSVNSIKAQDFIPFGDHFIYTGDVISGNWGATKIVFSAGIESSELTFNAPSLIQGVNLTPFQKGMRVMGPSLKVDGSLSIGKPGGILEIETIDLSTSLNIPPLANTGDVVIRTTNDYAATGSSSNMIFSTNSSYDSGNGFVFATNEEVLFKIKDDGKVIARNIKVSHNSEGGWAWPDYVFKKDYELLSLENVRKYIAENNHLPNVPSEEEISTEGIDLAEMNAILLRKIEELTLYLLEQEERIQKLENQ